MYQHGRPAEHTSTGHIGSQFFSTRAINTAMSAMGSSASGPDQGGVRRVRPHPLFSETPTKRSKILSKSRIKRSKFGLKRSKFLPKLCDKRSLFPRNSLNFLAKFGPFSMYLFCYFGPLTKSKIWDTNRSKILPKSHIKRSKFLPKLCDKRSIFSRNSSNFFGNLDLLYSTHFFCYIYIFLYGPSISRIYGGPKIEALYKHLKIGPFWHFNQFT